MFENKIPAHYRFEKQKHEIPSIAIHSEGAVHGHVRRAIGSGATVSEIYHAIVLLSSTLGLPDSLGGIKLGGRYSTETMRMS